jgi:hypothetical protein
VLLMVDEAQNLEVAALEELRMLSNLQLGSHPLLQILLLGQPEFRDLLASSPALEQLRQRVIAAHHLSAMEPGEVGPYIEHRLACVGWTGNNPAFDQRVYAELAQASGSVPRRVNQITGKLLLLGAVEQRTRIDAPMLKAVLADMAADRAEVPASVPAPVAAAVVAPAAPGPIMPDFNQALAARDEQIAELQQAVIELADARAPVHSGDAETQLNAALDRVTTLEAELSEQTQTLRHVLTMLIEWFETDEQRRAA